MLSAALAITVLALVCFKTSLSAADSADQQWKNDLLSWRSKRAAGLQAPEGWLSLIGLDWLKDGDNSFGASEDNRFAISAKVPAHLAVVRLDKNVLRLLAPAGGFPKELTVDGQAAKEQPLFADDAQKPSKLSIGTVTIIIIHRDDRYALRIKDSLAPTEPTFMA
jgi:uncharacterized protein (DUF1684 family)